MPDYKLLTNLPENLSNNFTILLFGIIFLMLLLKFLMPKRYTLNIKAPNIYIFEFEAQAGYLFSIYNILNLLIKLLTYALFALSVLSFCQNTFSLNCSSSLSTRKLFMVLLTYIIIKLLIEEIYLKLIKKNKFISKIRLIRLSFENYLAFYLFILAFLIFFFPIRNKYLLVAIISISSVWAILVFFNFYNSMTKHIDIKKYQIILYLCLSEILPFISLIGWIIFQIL